jgi:amino-acid N-acetyltransferase
LAEFMVRAAKQEDSATIRSMVLAARINPTGLDWRRFLVVVTPDDKVAGCGQIKPHGDGTRELASIVVAPEYRGNGISRILIERLILECKPPLYLMCRSKLGKYYEKFGFFSLGTQDMPAYFRRMAKLANTFSKFSRDGESLLVMKRE